MEQTMIALDHVGVPARDAAASARFLSEILELAPATPDGPEGEMYSLPIGASGARVLVTLLNAMEQRGAKRGLASLCLGGGNAVALAVER